MPNSRNSASSSGAESDESTKDKVIKGVTFLGAANIVVRFISFFSVLLSVRALTVFEYGIFTLFLSLTGPMHSLVSLGGVDDLIVSDVSVSLGKRDTARAKSILTHFFRFRLLLLVIGLLAVFISRNFLQERYGEEIVRYFWLFVILVSCQFIRNIYILVFNIYEKFKLLSYANIAEVVLRFIFIAAFFIFQELNVYSLILVYILGTAFEVLLFTGPAVKIWERLRAAPLLGRELIFDIFKRYGKWQIISEIISSPVNALRYWLIKVFVSVEAIGLLGLAQSLFSVLASLVPLRAVILPIVTKKAHDKPLFTNLLQKLSKYSMAVHILLVLAAQMVFAPLIPWVFPKYALSIPLFRLLSLRLLLNSTSITHLVAIMAYHRQKFLVFSGLLVLLSVLTLSPPLMLKFGVSGSVMESLIAALIIAVFREIYLRKRVGVSTISFKSFFTIDETDRIILRELYSKARKYLP